MDIYSLLNIKEDVLKNFPLLANRVADHQVERVINRNTSQLKKIEDRVLVDKAINVSQQSIDEIIQKVRKAARYHDLSSEDWSMHELRIISYYLMKLRNNADAYYFALALLDQNWKNLFFNGLVFYLINSWHNIEPEYRERTCGLLVKKLTNYEDSNKRYLQLKEHVDFFEPSGPLRLAALVRQKGMNLLDAPSLIGKKNSSLSASYFSDVVIRFYKDKRIEHFSTLDEVFNVHNFDRTRKLVFANLVAYENSHPDGFRRAKLCQYINRTLGDVSLASTWAPFLGASLEEAKQLQQAMKMVNIWFAQQIIETFFEICVQDKNRKEFWLNYVEYIDGFKIVGSSVVRALLRSDEKIGATFAKHFVETNSSTSQTSALVLFMKNKVLVEFSDTGALYVYNKNHTKAKLIFRATRSLNSTADLKEPSMDKLIDSYDWGGQSNNEEGKMSHIGYWSTRLTKWIQEKIINSNEQSFSFSNTNEESIFKATPLPKEQESGFSKNSSSALNNGTEKMKSTSTPPFQRPGFHPNNESHSVERVQEARGTAASAIAKSPQLEKKNGAQTYAPNTYLRNINYRISSKNIDENNRLKIVADMKGFYLYNSKKNDFLLLQEHQFKGLGHIWIKKTNDTNWFEIVHYFMGTEHSIGFFKNIFNGISFKKNLNITDRIPFIFK